MLLTQHTLSIVLFCIGWESTQARIKVSAVCVHFWRPEGGSVSSLVPNVGRT